MRRTAGWGQPPDHGLTTAVNGLSGSGAGAAVRRQCGTTVWQGVPAVGWSVGPVTAGVGLVIGRLAHADQNLARAAVAAKARKTARHHAAGEELAQLPFDEARQPLSAAAFVRLGQEGFEVLAHHAARDALLGLAPRDREAHPRGCQDSRLTSLTSCRGPGDAPRSNPSPAGTRALPRARH